MFRGCFDSGGDQAEPRDTAGSATCFISRITSPASTLDRAASLTLAVGGCQRVRLFGWAAPVAIGLPGPTNGQISKGLGDPGGSSAWVPKTLASHAASSRRSRTFTYAIFTCSSQYGRPGSDGTSQKWNSRVPGSPIGQQQVTTRP